MKTIILISIFTVLLLCFERSLYSQANNQILQAYVLQNKNLSQLEKELLSKAKVMVEGSQHSLELDEQQTAQLNMACQGDISRFMQDLSEVDLHTKDFDLQAMAQNQNDMQRLWPIVMPARQRIEQGLHGKNSLFQKTLEGALSEEQKEKYRNQLQQKQLRKIRSITKLTLVELEKKMPLTKKQRDQIVGLVEKSKMPKNVDENMTYYIGIIILAKLPKAELVEILTEDQFKLFQQLSRNADRFGGVNW